MKKATNKNLIIYNKTNFEIICEKKIEMLNEKNLNISLNRMNIK